MLCSFLKCDYYSYGMILNDLKVKVGGKFIKEISIEDDGDNITYVFPDTEEFLLILGIKINREITLDPILQ
jgi:hypothetical protein